ncbi:MAG: 50S ribosomal protein L11 methyltransferase [Myxococcales bacterium]|nr:50S ribosomal protein L11 methyltransferase [Myxococcales bacterium]MCB9708927.1 50S ribosomal protein L11 methyltransferase [Myxococcales bacterium]
MLRFPYLEVTVRAGEEEALAADLWSFGATGIEQRDEETLLGASKGQVVLMAHFLSAKAAKRAQTALAQQYEARLAYIVGDAWRDEWKRFFKTQRFGRLVVRPSWEPYQAQGDETILVLDPGRAFGSGMHASTRLLLRALQESIKLGDLVLDVGSGSGILSIAALLLGASHARGVEIDEPSVAVSLENAELNGVATRFSASSLPLGRAKTGTYNVITANIEAQVHLRMVDDLVSHLAPSGLLMLSGLLLENEAPILCAFGSLAVVRREVEGEWLSLIFEAPHGSTTLENGNP